MTDPIAVDIRDLGLEPPPEFPADSALAPPPADPAKPAPQRITTPGPYRSISRERYDAIEAINQSILKEVRRSPSHARHQQLFPREPTPALAFGTALHAAVLTPVWFRDHYRALPSVGRRSNADRAIHAAFKAGLTPDAVTIDAEDHFRVGRMAALINAHPTLGPLFSREGICELGIVWRDEQTHLLCKALIDKIVLDRGGDTIVVDLKTTQNASADAFAADCWKYGYFFQAAFYLRGLAALFGGQHHRRFVLAAVEHQEPHGMALYDIDPAAITHADRSVTACLATWAECRRTSHYPSYPESGVISLPRWIKTEEEEYDHGTL